MLKPGTKSRAWTPTSVSILGMLEGVLKSRTSPAGSFSGRTGFNPWYVGGGVKRRTATVHHDAVGSFNLVCWRVLKGEKSGVAYEASEFQSLVCWRC